MELALQLGLAINVSGLCFSCRIEVVMTSGEPMGKSDGKFRSNMEAMVHL
jgi:hypothetical protein